MLKVTVKAGFNRSQWRTFETVCTKIAGWFVPPRKQGCKCRPLPASCGANFRQRLHNKNNDKMSFGKLVDLAALRGWRVKKYSLRKWSAAESTSDYVVVFLLLSHNLKLALSSRVMVRVCSLVFYLHKSCRYTARHSRQGNHCQNRTSNIQECIWIPFCTGSTQLDIGLGKKDHSHLNHRHNLNSHHISSGCQRKEIKVQFLDWEGHESKSEILANNIGALYLRMQRSW